MYATDECILWVIVINVTYVCSNLDDSHLNVMGLMCICIGALCLIIYGRRSRVREYNF